MDQISYKALYRGENKRGYNGNELQNKEFGNGSGLELYDFNARTYDQQIGRFIQQDPLLEQFQEGLTPYHYSLNNPVRYNDPDGKIVPILAAIAIKFVVGAAIEYGSQVYDNYKEGKRGVDAFKPQGAGGVGKIILNGATSTIDPSGGIGKKLLITTATNLTESVGGQLLDGKSVTLEKTVTDLAVMGTASSVKIDGSKVINGLEESATKLERVAKNSPSKRNVAQATEARSTATAAEKRFMGAETATTEGTESALGKVAEPSGGGNRNVNSNNFLNVQRGDNTLLPKPVVISIRRN